MKVAIVILSVLAISGQGMSFTLDEVAGKFTATTANAAELISGVMAFLKYPEADVAKAKESKDPITVEIKVLKNAGPDYSVEVQHHNPIAEAKPHTFTAGTPTPLALKDGRKYNVDLTAKDKNSIVLTATLESGCKCALGYVVSADGAKATYNCTNKDGKTHDAVIDYKKN